MNAIAPRAGLPPIPRRMSHLPLDSRGYPIPWFVCTLRDGTRDFRVADAHKAHLARLHRYCWVCGEKTGRIATFVIGPMCAVNRTTSEPGCHYACAEFSATACPFLTLPKAKRNEHGKPEGVSDPAGLFLTRNPGVTCLWSTDLWRLYPVDDGVLFRLGDPTAVSWWAQKRRATRDEILASIDSGMPLLRAEAEKEGAEALEHLTVCYDRMLAYVPATA